MNERDELKEIITSITAKADAHAMSFFEKIMEKGNKKRAERKSK